MAVTAPSQPTQTYDADTLAVGSNSGIHQSDAFTMIPQLGIELGYQVNCNWRAYVGYNILYWDRVSRAASQIDLNLDPRNFPPIARTWAWSADFSPHGSADRDQSFLPSRRRHARPPRISPAIVIKTSELGSGARLAWI